MPGLGKSASIEGPVKGLGIAAGLLAASIWGGMYVVSKVVLDVIPPFSLVSLRLILGAACLAAVGVARGGLKMKPTQIWPAVGIGTVGFGISVGLQFIGTKLSSAANASLLTSASPAFILLFAHWLLGERLSGRRVAALILATVGALVVIRPGGTGAAAGAPLGNLALIGAAVTWGLYSVLVKIGSRQLETLELSLLAFVGGLLISLPGAAFEVPAVNWRAINGWVLLGVLYLGLVSTALAFYLWNKSLALLEAGVVSLLFFAQPVVGVGLGATVLGESLSAGFWAGAVLIASGLLLVVRAPVGQARLTPPHEPHR
jgi:drug/metabolite transporter (DMT)-like permease